MADWFWRKKTSQKEPTDAIIDGPTFTSYIEKQDADGFVLIGKSEPKAAMMPYPVQNAASKTSSSGDYETLYQFWHNGNNAAPTNYPMPYPGSHLVNPMGSSPSVNIAGTTRRPTLISVAPFDSPWSSNGSANSTPGSGHREQLDSLGSFLTGVPFKLSRHFSYVDVLKELERESFTFLKSKSNTIENLYYNFETEKKVINGTI